MSTETNIAAKGGRFVLRPQATATISPFPGRMVATISGAPKVPAAPGMTVDAGGVIMVVEQVFGDDDTSYVVLRRPAMWVMRGTTTIGFIRGWPSELQAAIPQLRRLPLGDWTEQTVSDAVAEGIGKPVLVDEPGVRLFQAVMDVVLDASLTDRPSEWRIKIGLARLGETSGF